ncbi:Uncharacterised protein [Mycobacterium tuberculosis]|nr:Uncharacterised protein [Mycobacterium tuberculosis]
MVAKAGQAAWGSATADPGEVAVPVGAAALLIGTGGDGGDGVPPAPGGQGGKGGLIGLPGQNGQP